MKILTKYEDIDRVKWGDFVAKHPKGNVFQTPEYYDVLSLTEHNTPMICIAVENQNIIGVILGTIITNGNRLTKWLTARSIVVGGPIVQDENQTIVYAIMKAYLEQLPNCVIYTEIRPVYSINSLVNTLLCVGFVRVGHYNLVMDITKSEEELFLAMHKERKRNVGQAEKAGLIFKEIVDIIEIKDVVKLIRQTYERKHVPLSYMGIFEVVQKKMSKYTHFFGTWTSDGKMIAGQVRLCYGNLVYAWFAGSDEAYFKQRPNDFLMWNVIKWSHNKGYALFDFGGGGEPGVEYGVRDYKLKYGCECYDYGRFIYQHRPITYNLASWIYKTFHKIID